MPAQPPPPPPAQSRRKERVQRPPWRFSLATLLGLMTAVALLLGLATAFGWLVEILLWVFFWGVLPAGFIGFCMAAILAGQSRPMRFGAAALVTFALLAEVGELPRWPWGVLNPLFYVLSGVAGGWFCLTSERIWRHRGR